MDHLPLIGSGQALQERIEECTARWDLTIATSMETATSFLGFGTRDHLPVVLKVIRGPGEEWGAGAILEVFDGEGSVRVLAHGPGAMLLERLNPGTSLVPLVLDGRDDEATAVIAGVIGRMNRAGHATASTATVEEWGLSFGRYLATGDHQVPIALVERAQASYQSLCASQRQTRLLHGDLQHYNILLDAERGWLAIDPKGVVGELEYEVGASLRNPTERPDLFASATIVARRLEIYRQHLGFDSDRALRWAFAQAVLSAVWSIEDGLPVDDDHPALQLAPAIETMLR